MDVCVCLAPHHQRSEHRAMLSGVTTPPRPHRVGRRRDASRSRRRSHTRRSRCHRCFCRFSRCLCHHRRRRPRRRPHHLSASWLLGAGLACGCCLGAWWLAGRPAAGWRRRGPGSARAASAARVAAASPPPANARCCPRTAAAAPRRRAAPSAPLVPLPLASRRHLITSPPLGPPHRSGGGGCLCRCRLAAPGR